MGGLSATAVEGGDARFRGCGTGSKLLALQGFFLLCVTQRGKTAEVLKFVKIKINFVFFFYPRAERVRQRIRRRNRRVSCCMPEDDNEGG